MCNLDLFGDAPQPSTPEQSAVPLFEVRAGRAVCIGACGGEVLERFEGLAYDNEQRLYVWTTLRPEGRSYIQLGSPSYEGALAEAQVLLNQSAFDF